MNRFGRVSALALVFLVCGSSQVAKEVNKDYATPEGRARIVQSLEDHHRKDRFNPPAMVAALGIRLGSTVADVGTGVGLMLPYLAEAVGTGGHVIAEDIQQDFLDHARSRAQSEKLANVTFVLGTERNPKLPDSQMDIVLVLDSYHHFDYPEDMLAHIGRALKPDGRLAIIDFYRYRRGPKDNDMSTHVRAEKDEVLREIQANGYRLVLEQDHGTNQYIVVFQNKRQRR
jgi:ubiquinone/menaquinone biosynthesis C-methylase UbiE